jgi:hypothetical protein
MQKLLLNLKKLVNLLRRNARKKDHKEHLWVSILELRREIVEDVLIQSMNKSINNLVFKSSVKFRGI